MFSNVTQLVTRRPTSDECGCYVRHKFRTIVVDNDGAVWMAPGSQQVPKGLEENVSLHDFAAQEYGIVELVRCEKSDLKLVAAA